MNAEGMESLKVIFIFAILISSFDDSTAQSEQNGMDIEFADFSTHVSLEESVYNFYIYSCCDIDEANSTCNKFGGFLAHVKTQQVSDLIKEIIVKSFEGHVANYYKNMLWIGLHRVVDDMDKWEWSDGTPLAGGTSNPNWHQDFGTEPNNSGGNEDCVGVATKRCKGEQSGDCTNSDQYVGQWADLKCDDKNKFICENPYGSGFVSKDEAVVGSTPDAINCTVFGDSSCSAIWYREGEEIPMNSDEPVYQHIDENTEYRTSTITFSNPLQSDDYVCSLSKDSESLKDFTAQLKTTPYLSEPDLPTEHKISETENITCTASGRPIPTITWKIGDVGIEKNDRIFQVFNEINEKTLTSESVFSIINPISFEGNTQLSCVAEVVGDLSVKLSNVSINTDFTNGDGSSYKVIGITSEQCENIKGILKDAGTCQIIAAEMVETEEEKCEGSELLIQMKDFTETATHYNLVVTKSGSLMNQYVSDQPWSDEKITIQKLQPRTEYAVQLNYQPQYWTSFVNLTKTFKTKGTIPEAMNINEANITTDNKCKVEFDLPSNIEASQLTMIEVNATETSPNKESYKTHSIPYTQGLNSFEFETENKQSTYKFTSKLITCAADIGDETETFQCSREPIIIEPPSPPIGVVIGACVGGFVLLVIIIICVWLYRRQKQGKANHSDGGISNKSDTIHKLQIPDVTYENIQLDVNTTNPHEIKKHNLLERYQFLLSSAKRELHTQYQKMKEGIKAKKNLSTSVSQLEENTPKNRYRNIVPYDETRVILSTDGGSSDYINACWIDGYKRENQFIAAQGPKPETIDDFWRMIYESESKVIVMLTNLIERGKRKCEQYWPERSQPYKSTNFTIKFVTEELATAYISRTFTVARNNHPGDLRTVTQYQFVCWPDHGVPEITSPILRFYNEVMEFANEKNNESSPVVVHCSAGVGRTGTFISLDILKEMLNNQDYVDIYQTVFDLRLQRMDMVQTVDQFAFLHKLVLEKHLLENTDHTFEEFLKLRLDNQKFKKNIKNEFSNLALIPVTDVSQNLAYGRDLNKFNRDPTVLPYDRTRVISSLPNQLTDDVYFNASTITNFRYGRKVISAQTPLPSTVEKFLNVIVEYSVSLVVMVSEKDEDGLYWADGEGASVQFGDLIVHNVSVTKDEVPGTTQFTITSSNQQVQEVQQMKIESWKDSDLSDDESHLLCSKLSKLVQQIDTEWDDNSTILIHCKDGSSFCGSLCALLQVNERLKMENKVDLFRVVKDLRDMRPQMVRTLGQYEVCHRVIEDLIQSLQTYANFR